MDGISDVAGGADHIPHPAVRADFVEVDPRPGKGILHSAAGVGDRADRRVHRARPVPLLFLLGSDADSHGAADRHVRPRAQSVRSGEVLSVHHDRFDVHAGRDSVALREDSEPSTSSSMQSCHPRWAGAEFACRRALALPRILHRFRRQGAAVPVPHLAAGRARRGAHRRLGAAGGRPAEDGHVRYAALQSRAVSRSVASNAGGS